jgi:hypothetical protein
MDEKELQALFARHKGLKGVEPIDKERTIAGRSVGKRPNPNPKYRYELGDGTQFVAVWDESAKAYKVVDGGTALTKDAREDKPEKPRVHEFPDGSLREEQPDGEWKIIGQKPKPETITRSSTTYQDSTSGGTNAAVDSPSSTPTTRTEQVSPQQAAYDRQTENDHRTAARQANLDAIAAANQQWAEKRATIADDYANRRLSLDQAQAQASQAYNQIKLNLDAYQSQISLRGQDIQAGVSQRGQDVNLVGDLARTGTTAAVSMNNNFVRPEALGPVNQAIQAIGTRTTAPVNYGPLVGTQPMYPDVARLPIQLAQEAQSALPKQYALPQAPQAPDTQLPKMSYGLPAA